MSHSDDLATALERIALEQSAKTGELDLSDLKLDALPEALTGLKHLQTLDCSGTKVADLTSLAVLKQLQTLVCSYSKVADLAPIAALKQLQSLDCKGTQVADLAPIAGLMQLQSLDCSITQVADLRPLGKLKQLRSLLCFKTQVADLAPLAELKQLQRLDCSYLKVTDLAPIAELKQLQSLDCANTEVADLTPLAAMNQLSWLDFSHTPVGDLTPIAKLKQLLRLNCSRTQVDDLTPLVPRIHAGWPVKWKDFNRSESTFIIADCPLVCPPVEFAQDSPEAVVEYFEQLGTESTPLNEIKVIFLGEGAAGKTSLIKRLRNEAFNPKESQTHGIRIQKTPLELADGQTVSAHLWDFGGQEVMHATHQFFLSQRCVYVLVLDSRKDEKAEYWLKHAHSFGARSPVLVVLNKIDENPSFEVNRKVLLGKYPQIHGFFRVSCQRSEGIDPFRAALAEAVAKAPTRRTPFPANWLAVKTHFADMRKDYIESSDYQAVCREHGVDRALSQSVLLQFLHDLGVVIHFRKLRNFDTHILNPIWLTNGVYRVINSERVAKQGGLLHEHELDGVINNQNLGNTGDHSWHYPLNKLNYIVRVMQEFELCYPIDHHSFIIPQLLPVQEPGFEVAGATLRFEILFLEFLPDSVFPRLMVKLQDFIKSDLRWRTGMVLEKSSVFDATARVRVDKEDRVLRIDVCGKEPRRFLSFIRATVKEIVADFAQLPTRERVPVPGCVEMLAYDDLVIAESAGEKEVFVPALKKRIAISALLDGVEDPVMRDEVTQIPVKAFVSYAHKDAEHLPTMRAALSPLRRLNKLVLWDDHAIDAGAEWHETIFRELDEADIVLFLVSADSIHSDFCYAKELTAAMAAANRGEKLVVAIRLRECAWDKLPLAKLQGTPDKWISSADDKDGAWTEVARKLEPMLSQVKKRKVAQALARAKSSLRMLQRA
jgi:internalin A